MPQNADNIIANSNSNYDDGIIIDDVECDDDDGFAGRGLAPYWVTATPCLISAGLSFYWVIRARLSSQPLNHRLWGSKTICPSNLFIPFLLYQHLNRA